MRITVLGGGLAGCEATWQLVKRGIPVLLLEMKPERFSPAHESENLAELVCSNSFRSASLNSAAGLLKEEMRLMDSLIMSAADAAMVPAGKALAVDRERFSYFITERMSRNPLVTLERKEVTRIPGPEEGIVIVATGPLTSDSLADDISRALAPKGSCSTTPSRRL